MKRFFIISIVNLDMNCFHNFIVNTREMNSSASMQKENDDDDDEEEEGSDEL